MDKTETFARFKQSIEYLKDIGKARKHEEIAELMNRPRPHISAAINGDMRRFTEGFVKAFAAAYSDYINEHWLLTGEGEMSAIGIPTAEEGGFQSLVNTIKNLQDALQAKSDIIDALNQRIRVLEARLGE